MIPVHINMIGDKRLSKKDLKGLMNFLEEGDDMPSSKDKVWRISDEKNYIEELGSFSVRPKSNECIIKMLENYVIRLRHRLCDFVWDEEERYWMIGLAKERIVGLRGLG